MFHSGPHARKPARAHAGPNRSGAVLIIVVGLSMVLLGVAVSFMVNMRSSAQETRFLLGEAQARLMLHAAMMYLQESSRLGWGEETYGWTDIRDGSLGPRPTRNFKFRTDFSGLATGTPVDGSPDGNWIGAAPTDYNIPPPNWWKRTWPRYRAFPDETDVLQFPQSSSRCWPCPGSVGRFPMAVPVQPPYATQLRYAYNPIRHDPAIPEYGSPGWDQVWDPTWNPGDINWWAAKSPGLIINPTFDPANGSTGMLDPQPQADLWQDPAYAGLPGQKPDFITGAIQPGVTQGDWTHFVDDGSPRPPVSVQLAVKPGMENTCWFRIYRELQFDHDNDGIPAYDRVALYDPKNPGLKNYNVFIIACGSGGTRGYRFWDATDLANWETKNGLTPGIITRGQEFAKDSPLFASSFDAESFHALLASSRILWYRVEWTAMQGGGWDSANFGFVETVGWNVAWQNLEGAYPYGGSLRGSAPKTYGGNFKWVQRLDHTPPNW